MGRTGRARDRAWARSQSQERSRSSQVWRNRLTRIRPDGTRGYGSTELGRYADGKNQEQKTICSGIFILAPDLDILPIPDHGVKKAPDPGSGSASLNPFDWFLGAGADYESVAQLAIPG